MIDNFKTFVCQMRSCHMFSCSDVKVAFFAVINSVAAITLKTTDSATAEFARYHIFKIKLVGNFRWRFEMIVNLQYGKILSMEFCKHFLISNDFLWRNRKTQSNSPFDTIQIFNTRLLNTWMFVLCQKRNQFVLSYFSAKRHQK